MPNVGNWVASHDTEYKRNRKRPLHAKIKIQTQNKHPKELKRLFPDASWARNMAMKNDQYVCIQQNLV